MLLFIIILCFIFFILNLFFASVGYIDIFERRFKWVLNEDKHIFIFTLITTFVFFLCLFLFENQWGKVFLTSIVYLIIGFVNLVSADKRTKIENQEKDKQRRMWELSEERIERKRQEAWSQGLPYEPDLLKKREKNKKGGGDGIKKL